ncbi:unnamed protein product [Schistosoma spindalis]|nr:unnamed protein product [Schistosoma spindale]
MTHSKQNSLLLANQLRRHSYSSERNKGEYLHEIDISLLNSVLLPPCEIFTESNAISFIEKYHKIKPVKYKAFVLPDRFVLHNKNRRLNTYPKPCIIYSEVKYIFTSPSISTPGCFVLCIDSCTDKQRRYELYKIKDSTSHDFFIDFLKCVMGVKARLYFNIINSYYHQRHSITYKSKTSNSDRTSSSSQDESESLFNYESSSSNPSFSQLKRKYK